MIIDIPEKLKRYAELKVQEKAITAELDEIKPFIKEHMMSEGVDKLPTSLGNFTISEKVTWKYSKAVETLQKAEKANGTASEVKSVILTFKATDESNEEVDI